MGSNQHRTRSPSRDRERDSDSRRHRHRNRSQSPMRNRNREDRHGRDKEHESKRRKEKERELMLSDDEDLLDLRDMGVKEISEDDYFLKSNEFKIWLKEERGKYLDEMSSESAHKYFRKFVRRWNDGALPKKCYNAPASLPPSENTGYKWSFASRGDFTPLSASVREDISRMTHSSSGPARGASDDQIGPSFGPLPPSSAGRALGPSLPSSSDRQYAVEASRDARRVDRKAGYKDEASRVDTIVPKSGGKEGRMEEKRAKNKENKEYREKDVTAGLEVDESTLMGDSNSFAAAVRRRNEAEARRREKKELANQDQRAAANERLQERKAKEDATMDMFKAMAKQRFG